MQSLPDNACRMSRRKFLETGGKLIAAAALGVGLSGCTEKKGGDDVPDKLAEPGKYLIRKANQIYNVTDISDAEKQISEFEKWADDMSAVKSLMAITAMPYVIKHSISPEGNVVPSTGITANISDDMGEYPFDANAVTMNMITQYLYGKIDDSRFSALFDAESAVDIAMMKKKGLTVDKYAVTEGRETGSDENVKYLINTYQTKPDASKQVLTGYMHLKLEKKGTKWVPTKVVESEVYAPTEELGFYYVGRFGKTDIEKPQIKHAWIEKTEGIPLIPEAIKHTGKTVDQYVRAVFGNDVSEGIVKKHYDGGRIIHLKNGVVKTVQVPAGDYELEIGTAKDTPNVNNPDVFAGVSGRLHHENGVPKVQIQVGEVYHYGKPQGLAWEIEMNTPKGSDILDIRDGYGFGTIEAADGAPDVLRVP